MVAVEKKKLTDYQEHMDSLMFRVTAVLDGERTFDVAGIAFALLCQVMSDMSPEGQDRVKGWIEEIILGRRPSVH